MGTYILTDRYPYPVQTSESVGLRGKPPEATKAMVETAQQVVDALVNTPIPFEYGFGCERARGGELRETDSLLNLFVDYAKTGKPEAYEYVNRTCKNLSRYTRATPALIKAYANFSGYSIEALAKIA